MRSQPRSRRAAAWFSGRGNIVLTASGATEYSFEGANVVGEGVCSVFTRVVVDGLRAGQADRDHDGLVTVDDLYHYVYDTVRAAEHRQTPELWAYGAEGDLLVARSPRGPVVEPAPLPEYLRLTLENPRLVIRESGAKVLAELLDHGEPGLALTARQELQRISEEDHPRIAALARDALDADHEQAVTQLEAQQTRVGKRTAAAAFRIATQLVDQGLIDMDEALSRVSGAELVRLMFPRFDTSGQVTKIATGVSASPGAAVGKAVFDSARAVELAASGDKVILVRRETNPDDLHGMIASQGILTSRGGKTSHAAVVARSMGKTCVCGAEELDVNTQARKFTAPGGITINEGDVISIDGTSGDVYLGEVPVISSQVVRYFEGELRPDSDEADDLIRAVHAIMTHADHKRRLGVYANADTGPDCARARRFGAGGVGLVRTEHMFLGERRQLIEALILADTEEERQHALDALEPLQRGDFVEILDAMDGLPVTIRTIDPPLHEFLPDLTQLSVKVALAGDKATEKDKALLAAVRRLHEQNPMLGLRGVRLDLVIPGLVTMQVRAIAHAAAQLKQAGKDPHPEVMIPLVAAVQEMEAARELTEKALKQVEEETGTHVHTLIGTMIEVPRGALTAGPIAGSAEFFSFGTNDLTQMTWGFSRDDVEGASFGKYMELGIFGVSPFETIDREGVGRLVEIAVREGREARPDLIIGVCGEQGGDPESVHFFHDVGLDYVSCSPFRVPIARLEAGRAALASGGSDTR